MLCVGKAWYTQVCDYKLLETCRTTKFPAFNIPKQGRKSIVSTLDYRKLERLVKQHRHENLNEITDSFNKNRERPVYKQTVQLYLHKNGFVRQVSEKKLVIREVNRKETLAGCREQRKLTVTNYWRKVNFSDETKIGVGQDSLVYIWRKQGEDWRSYAL